MPTADAAPISRPEVDAERCVLGAVVAASCRACVEACPRTAWVIDEAALGLDSDACDGCGICVAACPPGAIRIEPPPRPVTAADPPDLVLMACERAVAADSPGVVPCLHGLGARELAGLYRNGMRRLALARPVCADCDRGARPLLDRGLADLGRLLAGRGLAPLVAEELPAEAWLAERARASTPSRRSLFAALRTRAATVAEPPALEARTAARLLPAAVEADRPALQPVGPELDPAACTACHACAQICPEGTIRLIDGDAAGGAAYLFAPESCTGCGLCVDICEADAIALRHWRSDLPQRLELDAEQCRSCGNRYCFIKGRSGGTGLCRICATSQHRRNLFQVIE